VAHEQGLPFPLLCDLVIENGNRNVIVFVFAVSIVAQGRFNDQYSAQAMDSLLMFGAQSEKR
jgi:hypothetical protein